MRAKGEQGEGGEEEDDTRVEGEKVSIPRRSGIRVAKRS